MSPWASDPNPSGLCTCGCGGQTSVAKRNSRRTGMRKGWHHRFIGRHNTRGQNNPAWNGGRHQHAKGYWFVYMPTHPRANVNGCVLEHLLVAERALGRPIPPQHPVHHVNEDPPDNRPRNLVICQDAAYHSLLHVRMRAKAATGDPNLLLCKLCGEYDKPETMYVYEREAPKHRSCQLELMRRAYRARKEAA